MEAAGLGECKLALDGRIDVGNLERRRAGKVSRDESVGVYDHELRFAYEVPRDARVGVGHCNGVSCDRLDDSLLVILDRVDSCNLP
jgi:hypothetical protein